MVGGLGAEGVASIGRADEADTIRVPVDLRLIWELALRGGDPMPSVSVSESEPSWAWVGAVANVFTLEPDTLRAPDAPSDSTGGRRLAGDDGVSGSGIEAATDISCPWPCLEGVMGVGSSGKLVKFVELIDEGRSLVDNERVERVLLEVEPERDLPEGCASSGGRGSEVDARGTISSNDGGGRSMGNPSSFSGTPKRMRLAVEDKKAICSGVGPELG